MTDTLTPFPGRTRHADDAPEPAAAPAGGRGPAQVAQKVAPQKVAPGAAHKPAPRPVPSIDIEPPARAAGAAAKAWPPGNGPMKGPVRGPARGPVTGKGRPDAPSPANAPSPAARRAPPARAPANAPPAKISPTKAPPAKAPPAPRPSAKAVGRPRRSRFGQITFVLFFLIPTVLVAFYYAAIAADQYRVEVRFAVRGVEPSPLSSFGIPSLPGSSNESSDSYVIADYIDSVQIIEDIRRFEGVDLRQFFARPIVDFVHRIDPATPVAKFLDTWQWRTNVEYNSITGNTTFEVYAFTPEDARRIASLVLGQSERIVNELSREAREALISNAQEEVGRTQERLREISSAILAFRQENDVIDLERPVTVETTIITQLESQLADLRTRRRSLRGSVRADSPSVRIIDQQIAALEAQIASQQSNIGGSGGDGNLAVLVGQFTDLKLEEEFARAAYTAALQALETAEADARKQERYLATFVEPSAPDVSLHPRPLLYSLVGAFWFLICWALVVFVTRSVRDHAI